MYEEASDGSINWVILVVEPWGVNAPKDVWSVLLHVFHSVLLFFSYRAVPR